MDRSNKNFQAQSLSDSNTQFWTQAARLIVVAIAYWLAVRLGLLFVAHPEGVASIWPASGLALAILLLNPKKQWTKLLAVIFVTNVAGNLSGGNPLLVGLGFALANTLEAFLGAWALIYFCKSRITFGRTLEIFALFGVAIISNAITALLGAAIATLAFGAPYMNNWLVWWTSDGLGMILVTPFIITWATGKKILQPISLLQVVETVLITMGLAVFAWLLFGTFTVAEEPVLRNYMLFPILIWLAFRYSPRGMSSVLIMLAGIAVWNTLQGYGIFAFANQNITEHLINVQLLLGVTTFSGLFLSAMMIDLKQTEGSLRENEDKFKYVFENSPVGKSLTLPSGEMNANKALCDMFGYTQAELQSKKWQEITHPDDIELTQKEIDQLFSGKQTSARFNKKFIHKNGSVVWVDLSSAIRRDKDGKPLYLMSSVIDITEHKQTEMELIQNEAKFRSTFDQSPVGSVIIGLDKHFIRSNSAFCNFLGYPEKELIGKTISDITHPEDLEIGMNELKQMVEGKIESYTGQKRYLRKDGAIVWGEISIRLIRDANNKPLYFLPIIQNITERKRVEDELRLQSEILTHMNEAVYLMRMKDGIIVYSNSQFEELFGYRPGELLGKHVSIVNAPTDKSPEETAAEIIHALMEDGFWHGEVNNIKKDGTTFWSYANVVMFDHSEFGKVLVSVHNDITERKQAEDALRETSERLSHMLANSPTVIYALKVVGGKAVPIWISDNINTILGFSAEDGLQPEWWLNQIHPEDRSGAQVSLEHLFDDFYQHEYRFLHKDGRLICLHDEHRLLRNADNKPWEIIGAWTDITERKQAEDALKDYNTRLEIAVEARTSELRDAQEQLVRHEKLAVLGQLAGSVGHELRNPLAVINNAIYFLKLAGVDSSEKVKEYLGIIQAETRTAEKIITDLLDFARVKSLDIEPVSVSELIHLTLERFPAPPSVDVILKIPPDLAEVFVDPHQITQVLGNLTVNACQSMVTPGGPNSTTGALKRGLLTISAAAGDDSIAIAVKDTGVGILPENMKKLFEPLFTTKPKGIGLGLAVSRKLTEANGGRIEVQSEAGVGTTFIIYLPIYRSVL